MGRPAGCMHSARMRAAGTHVASVAADRLEDAREAYVGEAWSSRRAAAVAAAARSSAGGTRGARGELRRAIVDVRSTRGVAAYKDVGRVVNSLVMSTCAAVLIQDAWSRASSAPVGRSTGLDGPECPREEAALTLERLTPLNETAAQRACPMSRAVPDSKAMLGRGPACCVGS